MNIPLKFRPKWPSTLVTLILVPLFCALGIWQIHRAENKAHYLETLQTAPLLQAGDLNDKKFETDTLFRLELHGHFDPKQHFLIDNKHWHGFIGYQVVTPFYADGLKQAILINRGWVPREPDRSILPALPTPTEKLTLRGLAKVPEQNPFIKGSGLENTQSWPKIAQQLIIPAFSKSTGHELMPLVLLLEDNNPGVFRVEWQITPMPPEKHIGYAIQWFAMALVLLILYLVINTSRVRKL